MRFTKVTRALCALLAMLMLPTVPAQAESFKAIVTAKKMDVYDDEMGTWKIGTLNQTEIVDVEAYAGNVAKISRNGNVGYAAVSDMARLDEMAEPARINTDTRVFKKADTKSASLKVKAGLEINLLATNGQWAMVENEGIVAYMNKAHLTVLEEKPAEPPVVETPTAPEKNDGVIEEVFPAQVKAAKMPVYQKASTKSKCLGTLKKGVNVTVHAYNGTWAYIELNGAKGYAKVAHMKRIEAQQVAPAPAPEPQKPVEDYMTGDKYTTEQIIYIFLTQEMGLNTAVACGILANVEKECSFRVTAASYDGGYGIVQWTGVRNTRLKNWCQENDYNYATLEGQLWYLKYELEKHHPKTLKYLRTVENTPAGAYDAGHYFCYNFEIPASRAKRSVERGNLAKDKYWTRYYKA